MQPRFDVSIEPVMDQTFFKVKNYQNYIYFFVQSLCVFSPFYGFFGENGYENANMGKYGYIKIGKYGHIKMGKIWVHKM